jgi:hypothetical protein
MIAVDGIILVLSCQKHLHTRIKHLKLPKTEYAGWKVIYVIGDLFLDCDYKFIDNFMLVKCEDSYIHLLKKLVLSLKYLYETYDIKEGVLRTGDDLIFNEKLLTEFLKSPKTRLISESGDGDGAIGSIVPIDFVGRSPGCKSLLSHEISDKDIKVTIRDTFMTEYYAVHPEDFDNPLHNLKGVDISKYMRRPHIPVGVCGILFYLSNKAAAILIDHMNRINYDIFHYDKNTDSYPYAIEDCAVSFILYSNKISFIHREDMYDEYYRNQSCENVIATHTNLSKY